MIEIFNLFLILSLTVLIGVSEVGYFPFGVVLKIVAVIPVMMFSIYVAIWIISVVVTHLPEIQNVFRVLEWT